MIELIFILIIIETACFIWIIKKICVLTQQIKTTNKSIADSLFKGNLTELRVYLSIFNKKLKKYFEKQEKSRSQNSLNVAINYILFLISAFSWLKNHKFQIKKRKKMLQH